MSGISTHVLDLALGKPAFNVPVTLERFEYGSWIEVAARRTNSDGRSDEILTPADVSPGEYRLIFDTDKYQQSTIFPQVIVSFSVKDGSADYHFPLLLSPFGYSAYRGT